MCLAFSSLFLKSNYYGATSLSSFWRLASDPGVDQARAAEVAEVIADLVADVVVPAKCSSVSGAFNADTLLLR
jgi:hypothetical protein